MISLFRADDAAIPTYTGRMVSPLNPSARDISIEDIAHALSLVCRFTGHTRTHYSVAEHSLRVSHVAQEMVLSQTTRRTRSTLDLAREVALWGLLHDASEAYICDLAAPLKHAAELGQLYRAIEAKLMSVIITRFDLMPHEPSVVKDADRALCNTEIRDLMGGVGRPYEGVDCLTYTIQPMDPLRAELEFLLRYEALTKARAAQYAADRQERPAIDR